jgi:hypothetical protein
MLKQAHEAMEKVSAVASAVKAESWGEADRRLNELMTILDTLSNGIGEKVRAELDAPEPDSRDRG